MRLTTGYGRPIVVSRPLPFIPNYNGPVRSADPGFRVSLFFSGFSTHRGGVIRVLRCGGPLLLIPFCERFPVMVRYRLQQVLSPYRLANHGLRRWRRHGLPHSHRPESKWKSPALRALKEPPNCPWIHPNADGRQFGRNLRPTPAAQPQLSDQIKMRPQLRLKRLRMRNRLQLKPPLPLPAPGERTGDV